MNNNRKRDVEDLLRGGSVPPPPADLLDRIKNDIPAEIKPSGAVPPPADRSRTYWMPIAASLLLAVGIGVMMLVMNPKSERRSPSPAERAPAAATSAAPAQTIADSTASRAAGSPASTIVAPQKTEPSTNMPEVSSNAIRQQPVAIAEAETPKAALEDRRAMEDQQPMMKAAPAPTRAPARPEETEIALQQSASEGMASGVSADEARANTGELAEAAPAPPSAPAVGGAAPPVTQERSAASARKLAAPEPQRSRGKDVRFNFLRGGSSYDAARRSLNAERLPAPSAINPFDFLANFTYGDQRPARTPFSLSAELVSVSSNRGQTRALLRIAVTARGATASEQGTNVVLARDLRCEVAFGDSGTPRDLLAASADDHGARSFGDVTPGFNASALFDVDIASDRAGRVAVVTLTWREPDGSPAQRAIDISGADIVTWDRASAGFKLAHVAVSLAETLKGTPIESASSLLRHAELLPTWFPRDPSVNELASLVRKATRLLDGE